jgi:antitoxin (DNA-binding transcriptional repressor) of toxin-antitoxin stability system
MWLVRRLVQRFRSDQIRPVFGSDQIRPVRPVRLAAYNTYAARSVLSQLIARTACGEEIVIARCGVPVVKLVPYAGEALRPGMLQTHMIVLQDEEADD